MREPTFDWLYGRDTLVRYRGTTLDGGLPIVPCTKLATEPAMPPSTTAVVRVEVQLAPVEPAPGWLARAMRRIWGGR
jgi:hypothetical protein